MWGKETSMRKLERRHLTASLPLLVKFGKRHSWRRSEA